MFLVFQHSSPVMLSIFKSPMSETVPRPRKSDWRESFVRRYRMTSFQGWSVEDLLTEFSIVVFFIVFDDPGIVTDSWRTVEVQLKYSWSTVEVQLKYSWSTVEVQLIHGYFLVFPIFTRFIQFHLKVQVLFSNRPLQLVSWWKRGRSWRRNQRQNWEPRKVRSQLKDTLW